MVNVYVFTMEIKMKFENIYMNEINLRGIKEGLTINGLIYTINWGLV